MEKQFIAADDLLRDSFQLAVNIFDAGFKPDFLVGLWRGGSAVGIAVQEGLEHLGVRTDHIAIRTSYTGAPRYSEMVSKADAIRVHGLQYLLENLASHHSMLIVDDVFDTGLTIKAVITHLQDKARLNTPHDIRVAVPYYKPTRKQTERVPDYYLYETAQWLKYPHSLEGLSIEEVAANRPELYGIIKDQLG